MSTLSIIFNGFLVGATGYGLYVIKPSDNPYAFSACALGICHGLLGIIKGFRGEDCDSCNKVKQISTALMDIVPLPLINIQLYLASSSKSLAMGHCLFLIPLTFDMIVKLYTEEGDDTSTETLKDLTVIGNVVSLVFLAVNENNYIYAGAAFSAFLAKYGAIVMEGFAEGTGENTNATFNSILFYLAATALASGGGGHGGGHGGKSGGGKRKSK